MKPDTEEWVDKAENDWKVARREMQSTDPTWDTICFLSQQCAEKYLKAFLEEQSLQPWKTHDLAALYDAGAGGLPELAVQRPKLLRLGSFGLAVRYPGTYANQIVAEQALQLAEDVRTVIRSKLGLS